MNYLRIFYPAIFILGIFISYSDLRYGLIKNKHLLISFIFGGSAYLYILVTHYSNVFLLSVIINLSASAILAYFFYLSNLWSAGDAKLFITLSFLIPSSRYVALFKLPAISLLINIAILSFIFLLICGLIKVVVNIRFLPREIFKEKIIDFFYSLAIVFSISWFIWFIFYKITFSDILLKVVIIYIFYYLISQFLKRFKLKKNVLFLIFLIGILSRLLIQPDFFFLKNKIFAYVLITLKYTVIFSSIDTIFAIYTKNIKDNDLAQKNIAFAPFMILGALTLESPIIYSVLNFLNYLKK